MSSEIMYHRLRSCLCKKAYPVETMASRMADAFPPKPGFVLHVYRCDFCHLFHVGHTRAPGTAASFAKAA